MRYPGADKSVSTSGLFFHDRQIEQRRFVILRRVQVAERLKRRIHIREFLRLNHAGWYSVEQKDRPRAVFGQQTGRDRTNFDAIHGGERMEVVAHFRNANALITKQVDDSAHERRLQKWHVAR